MIKKKSYKEIETIKERGKKRFLERQIEESEAEQEIKEYAPEQEETHLDEDSRDFRRAN